MSSEHKRPMVAFVMVLVLGLLVLAGVARSEAVRGVLDDDARSVPVAGTRLLPQSQPTVTSGSRPVSRAAVRTRAGRDRVTSSRAEHRTDNRTDDRTGQVRRVRTSGRDPAQRHERSTHTRNRPPGHARSWVGPPAHAQAHGRDRSTPPRHAKAKGHRQHQHGKGHAKARGHHRH